MIQEVSDPKMKTKKKNKSKSFENFEAKGNEQAVFNLEKETKIKHYSSFQKILLVGEGDFSFALCLAKAFGSAMNMVATSLDSRVDLMLNYPKAANNLRELESMACKILHGVDVHTMNRNPLLAETQFDRIIFNFPHAGYSNRRLSSEKKKSQILLHQKLVKGYLKSSSEMVSRGGEIHVTHKTSYPYNEWDIEKLAEEVGLFLVKEEKFSLGDYPGYKNKRGAGRCDSTFPVRVSSTFIFAKGFYPIQPGARCRRSKVDVKVDIVDMACTYLERLDREKPMRGYRNW